MKLLGFIFLFISAFIFPQQGFQTQKQGNITIPFKWVNNLILIPVKINGVELTFLLDSGVNETLLFSIDNKEVNLKNVEKIKFSGLGEDNEIEGLKSINNLVSVGESYTDTIHTVYIFLDDGINFSDNIGVPVNGILGYQFFKNYPIQIDFLSEKITIIQKPGTLSRKKRRYSSFPISIDLNKPYINANIEISKQKEEMKLLLDTGNSDAIWLFPSLIPNYVNKQPSIPDFLGRGFNGDIEGRRTRIHQFGLGDFQFDKPIVALPDVQSIQHLNLVKGRKGSIGNEILRRFSLIFNYPENEIYLKKNRNYNDPFYFNKSGLEIKHDGKIWEKDLVKVETQKKGNDNTFDVFSSMDKFQYRFILRPQYSVASCRKDTPCEKAGIQKGDKIIAINGKKAGLFSLHEIVNLLKVEKEGKPLKIEIERKGETLEKVILLEDPIPYIDD